jgi:hypothetical protein
MNCFGNENLTAWFWTVAEVAVGLGLIPANLTKSFNAPICWSLLKTLSVKANNRQCDQKRRTFVQCAEDP